jgi:TolB-like protein
MTRTARFVSLAAAVAGLVAPLTALHAQKDERPLVAIMQFTNSSFSKDARDYDGLSKGIPAFLITDMSANTNLHVLEREQVQHLVDEQNLVTGGRVDQATAVKIGKLLSVHHMIFGYFVTDRRGILRMDVHAVSVETGEIEYVKRVDDKADNIMASIGTLAGELNTGLHLPPMPARPTGDASPPPGAQQAAAPAPTPKLPMRVALLYGKALDMIDHGEKGKALELFTAVLTEFPDYQPAKAETAKLKGT